MDVKQVGRVALALMFAGIAAYCAVSFVTLPYEMIQTCKTTSEPSGAGTFFVGCFAGFAALVAAFSPDWS